jgi:deoxyribonuclease V
MDPVRPEFVPDPSLSRVGMEALQGDIAEAAVFEDDLDFDPDAVSLDRDADQQTLGSDAEQISFDDDSPVVVGVDQAFLDDRAVSAVVALRDGEVIEEVTAVEPVEIPYIPGLLSFREGNAILAAFQKLSVTPDLAVVDGSGRIHFREAGLATHVGVTLDLPAVGVAKNLLCGTPATTIPERMAEGARLAIEADADVTAPDGTVIGYAFQSRQYDSGSTSINPLYVSPGHRIGAETAVDVVERCCGGYKLPEPTRLADQLADEAKADLR